jgi:hypothetical protein
MRHHFVPRGGCRRRLRLEKSAIAAPTLDGIAVVRAQGSTLARMNPEIRCTNRSHLPVMHVLGASSLLTRPPRSVVAPPQPLPRHRRAHLKGSLPACTSARHCRARAPWDPPSRPLPHRRRAHLMGPLPRACPRDPVPQPLPPRRRARLRDPPP